MEEMRSVAGGFSTFERQVSDEMDLILSTNNRPLDQNLLADTQSARLLNQSGAIQPSHSETQSLNRATTTENQSVSVSIAEALSGSVFRPYTLENNNSA